jgi:hypothetical protein
VPRDALSMISHEGYARAIRGRGHIFRRKRSRMTLPGQFYATREPDPGVPLELSRLDVYQETPPCRWKRQPKAYRSAARPTWPSMTGSRSRFM